ncbi:hypothetical protein [uncultured Helicobacter sp.]|uniref:hypothetical protein n=2 Tax=uncultured Helicobacter sp. TaxID=175537 RepID=UPI001C39C9F0|nr:DUF4153 domain-containing protein [Candidatus Helicobacter avicola]
MSALPRFKSYLLRVMSAYPLGLITLSVYFAYTLWAILTHAPATSFVYWNNFYVFVCLLTLVVDALTHKIHTGDRITRVGLGAIAVVLVSLVVYHTIFKYGFPMRSLEGSYAHTYSKRHIYYYLGLNAVVLGAFVYVALQDLERFMHFVEQVCVSVILWGLGWGLVGLIYATASMLDLDKMILFSKFWETPAPIILLLYAYGLSVRLLGFLRSLQSESSSVVSSHPLARIVLWIFNIFAFAYVALLIIYAFSPQKYFDGVVHLVLWFGIFLILLAWSNAVSGKSKICLGFLLIAIILESIAVWAIGVRISEHGFTPNRIFVLLAGVFFAFVALVHIVLESGVLESRFIESKPTSDITESVESKQKDSESVWSRSGGVRSFTLSPDKQEQRSCSDIIESKYRSQNLMRTIAVAFALCFGVGGFATPSVSIHSQLKQLESLQSSLKDTTTLDEVHEIVNRYNSALDFLEEFGQGGERKHLNASEVLDLAPKSLESKTDSDMPRQTKKDYYFSSQSFGLYSYVDEVLNIRDLGEVCWSDYQDTYGNEGYSYYDNYAFRICEDTLRVYDVLVINGETKYVLLLEIAHFSQKIIEAHDAKNQLLGFFTNKKRTFGLTLVPKGYVSIVSRYDPKTKITKQWIKELSGIAFTTKK